MDRKPPISLEETKFDASQAKTFEERKGIFQKYLKWRLRQREMHDKMHKAAEGVGDRIIQGINND